MVAFRRITLYLPTTQLLTTKIHTSGDTRKGSCSCSFYWLVFVWVFLCFLFLSPHFLKVSQLSAVLSPLLFSFYKFYVPFLSSLTQQPLLLVLVCSPSSSPSCLHPPFPTDALRDRLLPDTLGQCFILAFRESLLSTCRYFRWEPTALFIALVWESV